MTKPTPAEAEMIAAAHALLPRCPWHGLWSTEAASADECEARFYACTCIPPIKDL